MGEVNKNTNVILEHKGSALSNDLFRISVLYPRQEQGAILTLK